VTAHLRTPISITLPRLSAAVAGDAQQLTGQSLPCKVVAVSGQIVTVAFQINSSFTLPQVKMPMATWGYSQPPVQVGDLGYAVPADAYLGGMSGLGGGTAALTQLANLATLVFHPISNTVFTSPDSKCYYIHGVGTSGSVTQSGDGNTAVTIDTNGVKVAIGGTTVFELTSSSLVLTFGGNSITLNSAGIDVPNGDVMAGVISLLMHLTSEVQSGSAVSGPPVA
jgi:hypothetical protein